MAKFKHGFSQKEGRIYPLWKSIKYRCYSPTCKSYEDYGGRGIKMCDEWKDDFIAFYEWAMANGYTEEKTSKGINVMTIDRIDVNGNYSPDNCRFVTNADQARNKRNSMTDDERYRRCVICGNTFEILERSSKKETCSKECFKKWVSITRTSKKDYTKVCPICNEPFNAKRGGHFNDAVCCSRKCAALMQSPIWEYKGERLRVIEWAERIGINAHCLQHRKELGWTIEEILTTPLRGKRNVN